MTSNSKRVGQPADYQLSLILFSICVSGRPVSPHKVGMRAPIPFNSDVCNISKEVRIEHKLHINNIVCKWNYAVQSCVWAKLYVGSEACMLTFDTHWEVIVGRARSLDRI